MSKKSEHNRELTAEEKKRRKAIRRKFLERKKFVAKKEVNNFDQLFLLRCDDMWYKMGWNSAVIYTKFIKAVLGEKPLPLRPDQDRETVSEVGTTAVKITNLDTFFANMEKIGAKILNNDDDLIVVKLKKRYTQEEIDAVVNEEKMQLERLKTITAGPAWRILMLLHE